VPSTEPGSGYSVAPKATFSVGTGGAPHLSTSRLQFPILGKTWPQATQVGERIERAGLTLSRGEAFLAAAEEQSGPVRSTP
jgi:hypothetical protein